MKSGCTCGLARRSIRQGPGLDGDLTVSEIITLQSDPCDLGVGIEAFVCDGVPRPFSLRRFFQIGEY